MQDLPIMQKTYDLIKWYVQRPTNAARQALFFQPAKQAKA
jgi:hypothetical protein